MTNPKMPNHPEPEMAWTPSEVSCILTFVGAAVAAEREPVALTLTMREAICWGADNYFSDENWDAKVSELVAKVIRETKP
jgi:hypothetical protein